MSRVVSKTHSRLAGGQARQFAMDANITAAAVQQLARIGLNFDHATVSGQIQEMARAGMLGGNKGGQGMDAAFIAPVTTPSIPTPIQFLQQWLPGFVKVMTAARNIDEIVGISTVGSWEDEEIVQGIVEPAGTATEYGDWSNIPLTSWNTNFEKRTVVRGEMGFTVGLLEEGRAAAMRLNSADTKRQQAGVSLEIMRNAIGFYGWTGGGSNRTFGFLNDPSLPAFITAASGGWAAADFKAIIGDVREAVRQLRTQSQGQIDPQKVALVFAVPTDMIDYLTVTTDFGISVVDWIKQTYPKMRVTSAPELMDANSDGTEGVFYLFPEDIDSSVDGSTDGGEVFVQLVQSKFITLGVEKRAKSYIEDFSNATAGVMCKRPWAVVRYQF
ncbi:putative structural protein [Pseudomonas phage tabernarius]|uniref:Putative structural protein n=1 Tax=Pseudomonas phage tabernarius TaxID=2048978 RepID=A0A2H4P6S2_9CAUD|nr:major head protein [Pseudomonas phage tabernarius]ATW57884.1 putative structural protein [Pseudomonas phage tabernarius]